MNTSAQKAATAARAAADLIDRLDILEKCHVILGQGGDVAIFCPDLDTLRHMRRQVGPVAKVKVGGDYVFTLDAKVDGVRVQLWPPSGTCEQVHVGTTTVTVEEPVTTRNVTREQPVYEWRCPDSILDHEVAS